MALERTVGVGDHISAIAEEAGYSGIETIVNAEENSDLFARRPNPHQLVPGDVLLIPEKEQKRVNVPINQSSRFVVRRERLLLRVKAFDYFGEPIANESGTLQLESSALPITSDAEGLVEIAIPRVTKQAKLRIGGFVFPLEVGGLQPTSEIAGVRARLNNLGFWSGEQKGDDVGNEGELSLGVELLQEELGVAVDGRLTEALRSQLLERHGQ